MGRPAIIDDEKIIEIARKVFVAKGLTATTAEVAKRAGISQASIFKRFKSKQRLFLIALHAERVRQDWIGEFERRAREEGPFEALVELGVRAVAFAREVLPLVLTCWSNRAEFGPPPGVGKGPNGAFGGVKLFVVALEREMRAGRLKKQDGWLIARTFVGAMHSYALMTYILKRSIGPAIDVEPYVRGVVQLLFEGIAPRPAAGGE